MTLSKVELITSVLELNYALFWVDTDVVFYGSPFGYLEALPVCAALCLQVYNADAGKFFCNVLQLCKVLYCECLAAPVLHHQAVKRRLLRQSSCCMPQPLMLPSMCFGAEDFDWALLECSPQCLRQAFSISRPHGC